MTTTTRPHLALTTATVARAALTVVAALALAGCGALRGEDAPRGTGGGPGGEARTDASVRMARADWDTGFMQAAIYRQLLQELGYDVTNPAEDTRTPETFYPALAIGEVDLWANGWFPLHEPFLDRELVTGQRVSEPIEVVGTQVPQGAVQGYLIDKATAEAMNITSMGDFTRADVTAAFDQDGDGRADLYGCNQGWGCNLEITAHIAEHDWGPSVEQVVGDYDDLMADARRRVAAGDPTLFYTWTPNWTVAALEPGEDVVWLESAPLPGEERPTSIKELEGCAGEDPCELGWVVNDIRAVANAELLDTNPPIRRLLEAVQIPADDIAEQNARMAAVDSYSDEQVQDDASAWIADNRKVVDEWLDSARGR